MTNDDDQVWDHDDDPNDVYDQAAVDICVRIERSVQKINPPRFGHFAGILNALENHVEEGEAVPDVVHHLAEAFMALAAAEQIKPKLIAKLSERFHELQTHVQKRSRASAGR